MKKIGEILLVLLMVMMVFVSCDEDKFINGDSNEEKDKEQKEQTQGGSKASSSVMILNFNGQNYSTKDGVFDYTYNLENMANLNTNFTFSCYHYDNEGNLTDGEFTFTCDEMTLYNIESNSCTINALNLNEIGTYIVRAKSSIDEVFDRYFMINVISNTPLLSISYNIKTEYINDKLNYTEEMLGGEITKYTKEITLVAGAIYEFSVSDTSTNGYVIRNLALTSTKNCIYFREQNGNKGEFVCMMTDKGVSTLKFQVGQTNVSISVKIELEDITNAYIEYLDPRASVQEEVLCFVANPSTDRDKKYTYQINLDSVISENKQELMFCIDYEVWDEEAELNYLNKSHYVADINADVDWYTRMNMYKVWDEKNLFYIVFDGTLRQFSIVPLEDTIFNAEGFGEKNLHCYIYAKYKNDPNSIYRWKWRVMVGGVLEDLELYTVSGNTEEKIEGTIEIRENDSTGWVIKSKGVPSTTANHTTLWYVAKGISENNMQQYAWESEGKLIQKKLPIPAKPDDEHSNRWKVLTFLDGEQRNSGYNFENNSKIQNHIWNTSGMSQSEIENLPKDLVVYNYFMDEATENGESTSVLSYINNGEDCVLVVLNLETGISNTVLFKNYNEAQVIIKSLDNNFIPKKIETYNSGNNTKEIFYTNYPVEGLQTTIKDTSGNTYYVQSYENGFTGYDPSTRENVLGGFIDSAYRVFYMGVDSVLHLQMDTSFTITSIAINGDYVANNIFENYTNQYVDEGKKRVDLYLSTRYYNANDKTDILKKTCSRAESYVYVTLNNKYNIKLKIVVYYSDL